MNELLVAPPRSMHEPPLESKRVALIAAVFVSDLLLTGLVFGWAPLLLMLNDEQQYVELCDFDSADYAANDGNDAPLTCVAQENRLNLMFAVASVTMNAGALPIGFFLDYAGPKLAVVAAALVEVSGLLLLAFADSQDFDVFLPAYTLLAFGGSMTMMASFPASFLAMQHQTAILATISCLFDGSSVVFLVLFSIKQALDVSRQQLLVALAGIAAIVYAALIALWHVNEHALIANDSSSSAAASRECESLLMLAPESEHYPSNDAASTIDTQTSTNGLLYGTDDTNSTTNQLSPEQLARVQQRVDDEFELVDVALRKQLYTFEFAYIVVFAAVQVLRATIYIGTTNKLLENYGDRVTDFFYTKVFSFVLPLGFLFVPAIDHIVEAHGLARSLLFTNVLGVAYNALAFVPSLPVQCLTFLLFAAFRAFLYAVMSAFTAKTFGLKNLGALMGLIFSIGSVVSLGEYPAVYATNSYFSGDLTPLYALSLALCVLLFPFTACLQTHEHTRAARKQALVDKLLGRRADGSEYHLRSSVPPTPTHGLTYLRSPMVRKSSGVTSRFSQA